MINSLFTPILAIIPIPVIVAVVIACAAVVINVLSKKNVNSLIVLGLGSSGKTTIWNYVLKENRSSETLDVEDTKKTTLEVDGKKIKFTKGKDISGVQENVAKYYEKVITDKKEKKLILFVLDANRFLNDEKKWTKENVMRLGSIIKVLEKHELLDKSPIHIVMSHADELKEDREHVKDKILKKLRSDEKIRDVIKLKKCHIGDLRNECERIFKEILLVLKKETE